MPAKMQKSGPGSCFAVNEKKRKPQSLKYAIACVSRNMSYNVLKEKKE